MASSMFRATHDISSESRDSSATESEEEDNQRDLGQSKANRELDEQFLNGISDFQGIPGASAEGHAVVLTSVLLEHYCYTKASEVLNQQSGNRGSFSRDSPEVKLLGRRLYSHHSQFLSSSGIIAPGIDGDDWEPTRQYYRDGLDVIGRQVQDEVSLSSPFGAVHSRTKGTLERQISLLNLHGGDQEAIKAGENRSLTVKQPSNWSLQRALSDGTDIPGLRGWQPAISELFYQKNTPLTRPINLPFLYSHPLSPEGSRYEMEFEEECIIGRGSFGTVYRVKHHVDGQGYAVKKIPLSSRKLQVLQKRGLQEVDNILNEIRTLAQLEHTNVVRYFGAWAEYCPASAGEPRFPTTARPKQQLLQRPHSENNEFLGSGVVFEESDHGIIFENSISESKDEGDNSLQITRDKQKTRSGSHTSAQSGKLEEYTGGSTEMDEDDQYYDESVSRQEGITSHLGSTSLNISGSDIFSDGMGGNGSFRHKWTENKLDNSSPMVTLHIQMSLHPLNLWNYLYSLGEDKLSNKPKHCFHLVPSLKILLGIVAGVGYLHGKGIIHRDLKPANIFLSALDGADSRCQLCTLHDSNLGTKYLVPRIGDFGLVAKTKSYRKDDEGHTDVSSKSNTAHMRPVGTEFYRPPLCPYATRSVLSTAADPCYEIPTDESLDVYALGVILFELLYKIDTRMERQMVLLKLTCSSSVSIEEPANTPEASRSCQDKAKLKPELPSDFTRVIHKGCHGVMSGNEGLNENIVGNVIADHLVQSILGMVEPDPRCRWTLKMVEKELQNILDLARQLP